MNWIDIAWPLMGGACLMLGMVHAWAWLRRPRDVVHLVFALACVSVAVVSVMERLMMQSRDPAEYAELLRWAHVPGSVMLIALSVFVHLQYRSSRTWLCVLACTLRVLAVVANFTTGDNINFSVVTDLQVVTLIGGVEAAVPVGQVNPWMILGQANIVALIAHMLDTMVGEWRTGSREGRGSALRVCGGIALFLLLVDVWRVAVVMGAIPAPDVLVPAFLCVVLVMGHELGAEFLRSADLSQNLSLTRERLRDSERQAEVAARAGELGLWSWDMLRNRSWVTDLGLHLLGFAPGKTFDMDDLVSRLHPDDREVPARALDAALASGGDYRADCRVTTWDGTLRHLSLRGQLETSASGTPVRLHGIVSDITERRRLEAEATRHRDELAHLSRVVLLGEMSGSLAHELNQPLTAILNNAQAATRFLAMDPPRLDEVGQTLARIIESDKRAGEVIRHLRTMLRKQPAEHRELDVNEVIADVMRFIRGDLQRRNVEAVLDLAADLPRVPGDPVLLQQVLLNLVTNGSDAMDGLVHGRRLGIRTRALPDGGVQVTVTDAGKGIAPDQLETIFQPFVTTKADGMGLGLAVCTSIIESHRGRLWASNNDGPGASLHFSLPAMDCG